MIHIQYCDWLLERTRWCYLARSGYPLCPARNPLLMKPVRSRWLDIQASLVLIDLDSVLVHKRKKRLAQYPAILTLRLVKQLS